MALPLRAKQIFKQNIILNLALLIRDLRRRVFGVYNKKQDGSAAQRTLRF
jgi:hypothetical protein